MKRREINWKRNQDTRWWSVEERNNTEGRESWLDEEESREKKKEGRRRGKPRRERTKEEVPVTNCGLIVREIAPAACCALLLLLSVLHVVSSTSRQPPSVLKILILSGDRLDLRSIRHAQYCFAVQHFCDCVPFQWLKEVQRSDSERKKGNVRNYCIRKIIKRR